jgi:hypothetical protein
MPNRPENETGAPDIDLKHGLIGEKLLRELLYGVNGIECKREGRAWEAKYRAFYIETSQERELDSGIYVPSGFAISKAQYWGFIMDGIVFMAPASWLKEQRATCGGEAEQGHPPQRTRGWRLPLERFIAGPPPALNQWWLKD